MKTVRRKYGLTSLTLFFLIPCLIWLYLELNVSTYKKATPHTLITDSVVTEPPQASRRTEFINNIKTQKPKNWHPILLGRPINPNRSEVDVTRQPITTSTTDNPVISDKHIIVILSYMRSGSTLTADILQHAPGTVYVFEPFHSVIVRTRQGKPLHYLNGTTRYLKDSDLTDDFLVDELHKWFTCSYEELDVHSLSDNFHDHFSRSMRALTRCLKPKRKTVKAVRDCLPSAIDMCKKAKQLLFKFIRLPMAIIEDVYDMYSNLQVVHLLRDPRGMLSSQIRLAKSTWSQIDETSSNHCERVTNDLNSTAYLSEHYPEHVRLLLYERLAENPLTVAERLYKFVGLVFPDVLRRYISSLTSEGRKDSTQYGIIRGNSTRTAYSWRDHINFTAVQTIDKNCRSTYEPLGYQILRSATAVKDHRVRSFIFRNNTNVI